jgi:acetoin utilization protein AcuB
MLTKDWMTRSVIMAEATTTMHDAITLMTDNHIGMLPVMDQGKLVGIVTDRDIRRASPADTVMLDVRHIMYHLSRVELASIMTANPVTVPFDFTLDETAEVLLKKRISGCPVVDAQGKVIGVITKNDIFRAVISVAGLIKRGVQFGFLLDDRPGSLREVTDVIRKHGGRLAGIVSSYDGAPEGKRYAYIRAFALEPEKMEPLKEELKQRATILYMIDHERDRREIFGEA